MLKKLSFLILPIFLVHCSSTPQIANPTSNKPNLSNYSPGRVIKKNFPLQRHNKNIRDASMEQLFATLPYFKGQTYTERLSLITQGTTISGSLKSNYYLGANKKPHHFIFKENGYGHQVEISTLHESDNTHYNITITNPSSNQQILKKQIHYGVFNEATQEEFNTHRWIFWPLP